MILDGPFSLDFVSIFVSPGKIGVYVLSRDGKHGHYVGRSDRDLQQRIQTSAQEGQGYKYFWFKYADNVWQAYEYELHWYRRFWPYIDNEIEPAMPANALTALLGRPRI